MADNFLSCRIGKLPRSCLVLSAIKLAIVLVGYACIIKLSHRAGDAAEMAMIELVDFNEIYGKDAEADVAKKTRRSRRGSGTAKLQKLLRLLRRLQKLLNKLSISYLNKMTAFMIVIFI